MDYKNIKLLLEKYLDGTSSVDQENELKTFFTQTKNIPNEFQYAAGMFLAFSDEKKISIPSNKFRKSKIWIGVAASIALLMGMMFLLQKHEPAISTIESNQTNTPRKIILNDGNIIWLNKGAEVSYVISKKSTYNMLSLKGEAFFEFKVTKKAYKILAHNALIDVNSNTKFNVKMTDIDDNINITVNSGAIKVLESSTDKGLTLLVTAGNYCSVHKTLKLVFSSVNNNPNFLAWKTGEFIFTNMSIASVTDVLAQFYNVEFTFKDKAVASCQFSGAFHNKSIDYILNTIQQSTNCYIIADKDIYTISGSACL